MPKTLRCTDLIPGCDFVARGQSEDEVIARIAEHIRTKHRLRAITPEILKQIRASVYEEKVTAA